MPTIALLVESGATPSSITVTLDLFRIAARLAPEPSFRIDAISATGGLLSLSGGLALETQAMPATLAGYDAVVLPGFFAHDTDDLMAKLATVWQPAIARLRNVVPEALVAASCYGTFVLAESGLLDGRAATTTWWLRDAFAARYAKVRLDAAKALVDDGNILTAGAMTAHTELSLHVLRRLEGHALARSVGSIMLVDEAKSSQKPFMALQRRFGEPLIDAAIERMERDLSITPSAAELAEALHVSYRTLHRRFAAITGLAPLAYLQALRVERAKDLLEQSRFSVEQIAAEVGYGDLSAFRRIFARLTEASPAQYRKRFRRSGGGET